MQPNKIKTGSDNLIQNNNKNETINFTSSNDQQY